MNTKEYNDINICVKFIKEYILLNEFNIYKIDINTKTPYYKINVLYNKKDNKSKDLLLDFFIEKEKHIVLHHFSNNFNIEDEDNNLENEVYDIQNIIKIFYYNNEWITINKTNDLEEYINKSFKDFYEMLNKNMYYTYYFKNNKIKFLSKGIKNDIYQFNDKSEEKIILDNKSEKKEYCKYKSKCINPECVFEHQYDYNLKVAYKQYIIKERNKNKKFKSINCNKLDDNCDNHKYNRCIFKHINDPICNI